MHEVAPPPAAAPEPAAKETSHSWLSTSIPTVLVVAALAGVAVVGHLTHWQLPKFSELVGNGEKAADDWCAEHGVPETVCVECQPDVLPKGKQYGWCGKHRVHECPLCHPDVAQTLYPVAVTPAMLARAEQALAFTERADNSSKCKLQSRRLQFASEEAVTRAGISDAPVTTAAMLEVVAANGEITYDPTRVARLSSRVPGTVWRVEVKVGDRVRAGDVLALVDAAEVGKAKAEFLQAFAQLDLKTRVWQSMQSAQGALAGRAIQEAEAAVREARIRLLSAQQALVNLGLPVRADDLKNLPDDKAAERVQFLGLPSFVAAGFDPRTTTANLLPIVAPLDGVVVAREAVAGEVADATKVLLVVADNRQLWLNLDVRQEDARQLAVGQKVIFKPDALKQDVRGRVGWISTGVDEKTRTVKLRADLPNADGKLRASTFGAGRVVLREEAEAVVVPKEALHHEGCCNVVFVRDKDWTKEGAPKVFHVRKVVPGAQDGTQVEIIAGVLPGEVVATRGSGILRAELLKNHLGAG